MTKKLKNVLETDVPEKYFLSDKAVNGLISHTEKQKAKGNGFTFKPKTGNETHSSAITTRAGSRPDDNFIKVKPATSKGYETATENDSINFTHLDSKTRRGRVGKEVAQTLDTSCNQGIIQLNNPKHSNDRVYSENGCGPTLNTMQGGNRQPFILVENLVQYISIRKNKVDILGLQRLLKEHKNDTIKKIAELVGVKKTLAEHWFCVDKSFSIPDPQYWEKIKTVLEIKTNKFDNQIMEFETKLNKFEKSNRAYNIEGIAPTLTCVSADEKICIPVATPDRKHKQQNGRRFKNDGDEMFTVTTQDKHGIFDGFKIRKLTPRECFRLQDFPDSFKFVVSDSQLYKQAGNSITVRVLELIIQKLKL